MAEDVVIRAEGAEEMQAILNEMAELAERMRKLADRLAGCEITVGVARTPHE